MKSLKESKFVMATVLSDYLFDDADNMEMKYE
jgi:hypothetical protein